MMIMVGGQGQGSQLGCCGTVFFVNIIYYVDVLFHTTINLMRRRRTGVRETADASRWGVIGDVRGNVL